MDRAIKMVYDHLEGRRIDLGKAFISQRTGFELRKSYSMDFSRYSCLECGQALIPVPSKNKKLYFRHFPNSEDCELKRLDLKEEIIEGYRETAFYGESPRHQELKNKIGALLRFQEGVELNSIIVDKSYIKVEKGKRRMPDIYCIFNNKRIAFEIQLSNLSFHYILHRQEFYKNNGIYLIWIIDYKASPRILRSFHLDIKYIWRHQNLYRLNESEISNLFLDCHYKQPFIVENNEVHQKWMIKKVSLSDLIFNEEDYSCYYFHYEDEQIKKINELSTIKWKIIEQEKRLEAEKHKKEVNTKADAILMQVKKHRKEDYGFYSIFKEVNNFESDLIAAFNDKFKLNNLSKEGIPYFLKYIRDYKPKKVNSWMTIVEFLVNCLNIKFDVNLKDKEGNGIIQYLYGNKFLASDLYKSKIYLFERNYLITKNDVEYISSLYGLTEYLELSYYAACDTLAERKSVSKMLRFLYFVESCIRVERINSDVKSWVTYLNNIMAGYKDLWKYIIIVLKKTQIGEIVKEKDKKGTILRKIKEYNLKEISCSIETYSALVKIYPEIFL
ncbi:DUF6035 family protein [Sphingobacterium siyangense]|uniref:DUF6035 family protein n=1 Tax=Sphingobacterium siyangense TaxID=459529 RepID=UPI002FDAD59F